MARKSKHEVDSGELELDLGETEGAEVEVEAAPETPVSEPVDVLDEQRVEEKPSAQEEAQKADDDNKSEQEEYSASVQKRIDRLTKKMREAERREQEALRYAQNVQGELHTTRQRMTALDHNKMPNVGNSKRPCLNSLCINNLHLPRNGLTLKPRIGLKKMNGLVRMKP
jgi:HD-GYP domain-containing protein (c-di-GMP phosphodiesterase class II)